MRCRGRESFTYNRACLVSGIMRITRINVIRKRYTTNDFLTRHTVPTAKILNVGSGFDRLEFTKRDVVNVDIERSKDVDVVCDAHNLAIATGSFQVCVLSAVLQYCRNPRLVVDEVDRVLATGGIVFVDAPFVQPYCSDTPDLFRFTKDGLCALFDERFTIVECEVSIPSGSALAFYVQRLVGRIRNRYLHAALSTVISLLLLPVARFTLLDSSDTAGAFYLIARKTRGSIRPLGIGQM